EAGRLHLLEESLRLELLSLKRKHVRQIEGGTALQRRWCAGAPDHAHREDGSQATEILHLWRAAKERKWAGDPACGYHRSPAAMAFSALIASFEYLTSAGMPRGREWYGICERLWIGQVLARYLSTSFTALFIASPMSRVRLRS